MIKNDLVIEKDLMHCRRSSIILTTENRVVLPLNVASTPIAGAVHAPIICKYNQMILHIVF